MKTIIVATAGLALIASLAIVPQSAEAQQRGAPRGSYQQSCTGAYVNQGRLYADCRDTRRNVRESSIQLNRCSDSDIGNDNGLLVCNGQRGDYEDGGRPGRPDGGGRPDWGNGGGNGGGFNNGRDSITVYKDANFRGQQATFQGAVPNLSSTGLNDAVSSMTFRGEWEACTDSNFRGQCQVFRNDVRNLDRAGMNDRISSLRPLRGRY